MRTLIDADFSAIEKRITSTFGWSNPILHEDGSVTYTMKYTGTVTGRLTKIHPELQELKK